MMTFKVGDRVKRIAGEKNRGVNIGDIITVEKIFNNGDFNYKNGYHKSSYYELVTPTTFEIGKKYVHKNLPNIIWNIEYIYSNGYATGLDSTGEIFNLRPDRFSWYVEYIPLVEEWRAVYYDKTEPKLSAQAFPTELEAKMYAKQYLTNITINVIRTDKGAIKK